MPVAERAVANTSPLLNLALVERLDLLEAQFSGVLVPEQVWDELTEGEDGVDDLERYRERDVLEIVPVEETDLFRESVANSIAASRLPSRTRLRSMRSWCNSTNERRGQPRIGTGCPRPG